MFLPTILNIKSSNVLAEKHVIFLKTSQIKFESLSIPNFELNEKFKKGILKGLKNCVKGFKIS